MPDFVDKYAPRLLFPPRFAAVRAGCVIGSEPQLESGASLNLDMTGAEIEADAVID